MPQATFLVTLELDDVGPAELALVAADISDLIDVEFDVAEVEPWQRSLVPPTTTTETNKPT